ncbi:MAG: DUF1254 domain-containing protein [Steroidobacteraceae bacterium]
MLFAAALAFSRMVGAGEGDPRLAAVERLEEAQALHVGTLAYVYGFPMVDMTQNMYRDTATEAPVNALYRPRNLVTPETAGTLRAPNSDTLYLRGWFDLREGPVVVRAPDTGGRYYTLAITDFLSEVQHVGRRTTGTQAIDFVLLGPDFAGEVPEGLYPVRVPTHQAWLLGRVLVSGQDDLEAARVVLDGFEVVRLAEWQRGVPITVRTWAPSARDDWQPTLSTEFFEVLNRWLRSNPRRPGEEALLAQFDAVGFGPAGEFHLAEASPAVRRGLERAVTEGRALLADTARRPLSDVRNGWIFPTALGRYGYDYLMRATVAFSGYANLPEETIYAALTADALGRPLTGQRDYLLRFSPGARRPAAAFWSLSAYRLKDFALMPNAAGRYSIGDHVPGFKATQDGAFVIRISREPSQDPAENWLPVGEGPYSLVMRLYEPDVTVLDGRYAPPTLEVANDSAGR